MRKLTSSKNQLIQNGQIWWRTIHPFMIKLAGVLETLIALGLIAPALVYVRIAESPVLIIGVSAALAAVLSQLLALAVLSVHRVRISRRPYYVVLGLSLITLVLGILELIFPSYS